jgi:hypothetical protein
MTRRRTGLAAGLLGATLLLAGCPWNKAAVEEAGQAAGRLADDVAGKADDVGRGYERAGGGLALPGVPEVPPAQAGNVIEEARRVAVQLVARYTDDLDLPSAREVADKACTAKDLYDTGRAPTLGAAVAKVYIDNGGNSTLRRRVEGLATDLEKARTSLDATRVLAVFAVCEST